MDEHGEEDESIPSTFTAAQQEWIERLIATKIGNSSGPSTHGSTGTAISSSSTTGTTATTVTHSSTTGKQTILRSLV